MAPRAPSSDPRAERVRARLREAAFAAVLAWKNALVMRDHVEQDTRRWGEVVRRAGIKLQ